MRVLITGDRYYKNYEKIFGVLKDLPRGSIIIEGGATGADFLGKMAAINLNLKYEEYRADWAKSGKVAGIIRNRLMIKKGLPDVVFAFHDNLTRSKGTKHMIKIAEEYGIPVRLF